MAGPDKGRSAGGPAMDPAAAARATTLLKALANDGRLEVLCQLSGGEQTVGQIVDELGMTQAGVSQILMRLRAEGIVAARREGRNVYYAMTRPEVAEIIAILRSRFCAL